MYNWTVGFWSFQEFSGFLSVYEMYLKQQWMCICESIV